VTTLHTPSDIITPPLSRRRFLTAMGLAGATATIAPRWLFAQHGGIVEALRRDAAAATIAVQPLRGGISALMGSGGNIAVLPGPDGKVLVDAGISDSRARIAAALSGLSADPITHLINTHWHFDHTDGNAWLHAAGAAIIAHENTRTHLQVATRVEGWQFTFPAVPAGAIPQTVFSDTQVLHLNHETLLLQHYEPAHTDSDISVRFADADVLHVGDTWWNGLYPFIDYSTGGSIDGTIRAAEANIAAVGPKTIVIPGHGPIGDRSGLVEFRDMLVTIRDRIAALKTQGRSLADIVAAKPTASFDAKWGDFPIDGKTFAGLVYAGV